MSLSKLGADILVVHLRPLLSRRDVLSLSTVNTALFHQLEFVRFRNTVVRYTPQHGMLLDYLRPETLRMIKHLDINGTGGDLDRILASQNFTGVTAGTILAPIHPDQQKAFRHIALQLTELSEVSFKEDEPGSSTNYLGDGALQNLHTFYLQNVSLPPLTKLLSNGDGIALNLTVIAFLPFCVEEVAFTDKHTPDGYVFQAIELLRIVGSNRFVPSLRQVHVGLGRGSRDESMRSKRIAFFTEVWKSAAAHGMWRLVTATGLPLNGTPFVDGWECSCDKLNGDLFLTPEEVSEFSTGCKRDGRYPRFEDFHTGNIHITIKPTGHEVDKLDRDLLDQIRGVSVLPGDELNIEACVDAVTDSTRCILIQIQSQWGTVAGYPNAKRFSKIETLRIQNVGHQDIDEEDFEDPRPYNVNLPLAILTCLSIQQWTSLSELTVPAMALQRGNCDNTIESGPIAAICGRHLPAYAFAWLSTLQSLRTLQVINWLACSECCEELCHSEFEIRSGDSFLGELKRRIPHGVTLFLIAGTFWCESDEGQWALVLANEIGNAVGSDVSINLSHLSVQVVEFEDDEAEEDDN